jgi:tRNA threonylcarbamoyl adenosine modification protein YeaZ
MNLLVIDAALEACSVGVAVGDGDPILNTAVVGRGHGERLMPMIADAMTRAGLAFDDLDRIGVTIGPGSFTGVRLGVAAARGLALVTGAAAVGVGTLAVHAAEAVAAGGGRPIVAVLAAGRGEVYGQRFTADGEEDGPPEAASAPVWAARVAADAIVAGSGADALAAILGEAWTGRVAHRRSAPDVATLIKLARAAPRPDRPPRPAYLRQPDAKPRPPAPGLRL